MLQAEDREKVNQVVQDTDACWEGPQRFFLDALEPPCVRGSSDIAVARGAEPRSRYLRRRV